MEFVRTSLPELLTRADAELKQSHGIRAVGGHLTAWGPYEGQKAQRIDLGGLMLRYEAPRHLYLSATVVGKPAILIGSNDDRYWAGTLMQGNQLLWGHWKNVDRPCTTWRAMSPNRLVDAMGYADLRNLQGQYLGPFLEREAPYHVLRYLKCDEAGNWYVARKVFLIVTPRRLLISRIVYFDNDYEVETEIVLSQHQHLSEGDVVMTVPKKVKVAWPLDSAWMEMDLGKVKLGSFPARALEFPDTTPYERVEQVDRNCAN